MKWIPTTQFQVAQTGEDKILRYSYLEKKLRKHSTPLTTHHQIVETSGIAKKMGLCGGSHSHGLKKLVSVNAFECFSVD